MSPVVGGAAWPGQVLCDGFMWSSCGGSVSWTAEGLKGQAVYTHDASTIYRGTVTVGRVQNGQWWPINCPQWCSSSVNTALIVAAVVLLLQISYQTHFSSGSYNRCLFSFLCFFFSFSFSIFLHCFSESILKYAVVSSRFFMTWWPALQF